MSDQDVIRQRFKLRLAVEAYKAARAEAVQLNSPGADESLIAATTNALMLFVAASEVRGAMLRETED